MSPRLYHFTEDPRRLREQGFAEGDVEGLGGRDLRGVLVHGSATARHEGLGEYVVEIDLPGPVDLQAYVVCDPRYGWAWCVPVEVLRQRAAIRLLRPGEAQRLGPP